MRTQTILTLVVLLFGFSIAGFAQVPDRPSKTRANQSEPKSSPSQIDLQTGSSGSYHEAGLPGNKGSAFLNPHFIEGVISFKDGSRVEGNPMRYNLYTQQMQFIQDNDTLAIGNPGEIEYIRIADKVFVYTDYLHNGEHQSGYFELLEDGDCRLLKRWVALYHEVGKENSSGTDSFYRDCNCYLQFFMNPASPVQKKRRDFAMSFASNGGDVMDYMKDVNLKPKNETDLIRIVEYYNNLQ